MIPSFSTFNFAGGMFITGLFILGVWYTNTWNTAYLPINSNRIYDHFGKLYNVSRTLDNRGMFDLDKYSKYSAPYMSAANSLLYGFFFAIYAAVITHVILYHRYELKMGFKNLVKGLRWRRNKKESEGEQGNERAMDGEYLDIHNRLMAAYPEGNPLSLFFFLSSFPLSFILTAGVVSEWYYFLTLIISIVFGVLGIALWPTYTSPAVVLYGIWLCLMFVVPVGIVAAMTGIEVTLNVLAEFIGGMIVEGNALAMNFFKSYG